MANWVTIIIALTGPVAVFKKNASWRFEKDLLDGVLEEKKGRMISMVETSWEPPTDFIKHLADRNPDLHINAKWVAMDDRLKGQLIGRGKDIKETKQSFDENQLESIFKTEKGAKLLDVL